MKRMRGTGCLVSPNVVPTYPHLRSKGPVLTVRNATTGVTTIEMPLLPPKMDLAPSMGPIHDQGQTSTCVAHACMSILEYHLPDLRRKLDLWSVYNERSPRVDGMYLTNAADILENKGMMFKDSKESFKITRSYSLEIGNVEQAKHALFNHGPLMVAVNIYDADLFGGKQVWKPIFPSIKWKPGGHCLCINGYDEKGFYIRNSWGNTPWCPAQMHMSFDDYGKYTTETVALVVDTLPRRMSSDNMPATTDLGYRDVSSSRSSIAEMKYQVSWNCQLPDKVVVGFAYRVTGNIHEPPVPGWGDKEWKYLPKRNGAAQTFELLKPSGATANGFSAYVVTLHVIALTEGCRNVKHSAHQASTTNMTLKLLSQSPGTFAQETPGKPVVTQNVDYRTRSWTLTWTAIEHCNVYVIDFVDEAPVANAQWSRKIDLNVPHSQRDWNYTFVGGKICYWNRIENRRNQISSATVAATNLLGKQSPKSEAVTISYQT
jgi:hypothetical protein